MRQYASEITASDILNFNPLNPQILETGPQMQRLNQIGIFFCDTISDCGKAYPRLKYRLDEIAMVGYL